MIDPRPKVRHISVKIDDARAERLRADVADLRSSNAPAGILDLVVGILDAYEASIQPDAPTPRLALVHHTKENAHG